MGEAGDWGLLDPLRSSTAESIVGDDALLDALAEVETALTTAWGTTTAGGTTTADAAVPPAGGEQPASTWDRERLREGSRRGGNPVIPLVNQLRERGDDSVHRGATSQDVLDTALVLTARRALEAARHHLELAGDEAARIADHHRSTLAAGRTLGQQASPTTFGITAASWLDGIDAAAAAIERTRFVVQLGGSVGTGEAFADLSDDADRSRALRADFAGILGLDDDGRAWHTERSPLAEIASAAALATGVAGRIGAAVATRARTEIAELAEGSGGGSSAMPHKSNPTTSVLLVAAAKRAPGLLATVYGSLVADDERPAGAWHAEWLPLRELLRLAIETSEALAGLLGGLTVDTDAMVRALSVTRGLVASEHVLSQLTRLHGRVEAVRRIDQALSSQGLFLEGLRAELEAEIDFGPTHLLALSHSIVEAAIARHGALTRRDES